MTLIDWIIFDVLHFPRPKLTERIEGCVWCKYDVSHFEHSNESHPDFKKVIMKERTAARLNAWRKSVKNVKEESQ
ncbi:MAG: hypothetical protein EPO20_30530 [Betaproteobacteria bacterium]|nr:MAG: hypothetical protein EPO20_30530 [Betaproteobacteria bacterium]